MEIEKGTRLLHLYQELTSGNGIQKQEAALRFHVNEPTIQRDIEDLRSFLAEQDPPMEVCYVAKGKHYYLVAKERRCLDCGEILAVCKVLLESRSLKKSEMDAILGKH